MITIPYEVMVSVQRRLQEARERVEDAHDLEQLKEADHLILDCLEDVFGRPPDKRSYLPLRDEFYQQW